MTVIQIGLNHLLADSLSNLTPNYSTPGAALLASGDDINLQTSMGADFAKYPLILYVDIYADPGNADPIDVCAGVPLPILANWPFSEGRKVAPGESWRQDCRQFPWLFNRTVGGSLSTTPPNIPNDAWPNPPVDPAQPHGIVVCNNAAGPARFRYCVWGIV